MQPHTNLLADLCTYILKIHHSETLTAKYLKSTPSKSNHVAVTAPLCKPAFPAKMKYLPEREGKGGEGRMQPERFREKAPGKRRFAHIRGRDFLINDRLFY